MHTKDSETNPFYILGAAVVAILLIWGAFTVFGNNSSQPSTTPTFITTLYTNTTANVRTCAASTCAIAGTYSPNTPIPAPTGITDFSQLPEWISFSYTTNDGSSATGYINKSVLSENQTSITASAPAQTGTQTQPIQTVDTSSAITNSAPCLAIAKDAAQSEVSQGISNNISVLQAHFKNGACYYELSYRYDTPVGKMTSVVIHAAPTDVIVAYCGTPEGGVTSCFDNNYNSITLSVFRLIEANLLTN